VPFEFPSDLAAEVYPLAWLVGRWSGTGEINHPAVGRLEIASDVVFDHDGGPYLRFESTIRVAHGESSEADVEAAHEVFATETGYWRVAPIKPAELTEDQHPLEVLVADASGRLALYLGYVGGGQVHLSTDFIARTSTAAEVTAARRMYGLVNGNLLWAEDLAGLGEPMRTFASAELTRQD
jgi:hypothetical protein